MQPTDEQRAILADGHRVIRINARAGTGKTTTLRMLAERNSDKSLLYLAFNHRARAEAKEKFPGNVTVHTVHSLAYRFEGYKWKETLGTFSPLDLLPAFGEFSDPQTLSSLAHDFLNFFLNSPHGQLEDATHGFLLFQPDGKREIFSRNLDVILDAARGLATRWNRGDKSCPHDFYLKLFHKSGAFERVLNGYGMVLVDEAQDLSPVMVDALKKCGRRLVVVGDSHQQIYGFRHAVNAMSRLKADAEYELSMSFRFGKPIADLATRFIGEAKEEQDFKITGNPDVVSTVKVSDAVPTGEWAFLCRTNLALFNRALGLVTSGMGFRFERNLEPTLWQVLDVYNLFSGREKEVKSEWVRSFATFERLKRHADGNEDFQLKGLCQVVERHYQRFPQAIFDIHRMTKPSPESHPGSGMVLSTIHSAKGQEYPRVMIDQDVAEAIAAARKAGDGRDGEEVNIAYVGFTRPVHDLVLSPAFLDLLGANWRAHLLSLQRTTPARPSISAPLFSSAERRASPVGTRPERRLKFAPPVRELKPKKPRVPPKSGDKVETAHGPGVVVETEGDKCLVSLEGQDVSLWEWARSLKVRP